MHLLYIAYNIAIPLYIMHRISKTQIINGKNMNILFVFLIYGFMKLYDVYILKMIIDINKFVIWR